MNNAADDMNAVERACPAGGLVAEGDPKHPPILLNHFQRKSGSKSAQKARKRFCKRELLKSNDSLAFMCDAATQTNEVERRIGHEEELITLTEATKHLPKVDGKKVAVCTLWRWCRKGLRGVYLEYVRVGRRICTTRQALHRFFTDLAEIDKRIEPDR